MSLGPGLGFIAGGGVDVFSDVVHWYEATDTDSYSGSGSTWADIGSGGYDLTLGASTQQPTFTGSGNAAYFDFDGGDEIVAGSLPTGLWADIHKNTQAYTLAVALFIPEGAISSTNRIIDTRGTSGTDAGFIVSLTTSETIAINMRGNSWLGTNTTQIPYVPGAWNMFVISLDPDTLDLYLSINNSPVVVDTTGITGTTTGNLQADSRVTIGNDLSGSGSANFTGRIATVALWDKTFTSHSNIYSALQSKHGGTANDRGYTGLPAFAASGQSILERFDDTDWNAELNNIHPGKIVTLAVGGQALVKSANATSHLINDDTDPGTRGTTYNFDTAAQYVNWDLVKLNSTDSSQGTTKQDYIDYFIDYVDFVEADVFDYRGTILCPHHRRTTTASGTDATFQENRDAAYELFYLDDRITRGFELRQYDLVDQVHLTEAAEDEVEVFSAQFMMAVAGKRSFDGLLSPTVSGSSFSGNTVSLGISFTNSAATGLTIPTNAQYDCEVHVIEGTRIEIEDGDITYNSSNQQLNIALPNKPIGDFTVFVPYGAGTRLSQTSPEVITETGTDLPLASGRFEITNTNGLVALDSINANTLFDFDARISNSYSLQTGAKWTDIIAGTEEITPDASITYSNEEFVLSGSNHFTSDSIQGNVAKVARTDASGEPITFLIGGTFPSSFSSFLWEYLYSNTTGSARGVAFRLRTESGNLKFSILQRHNTNIVEVHKFDLGPGENFTDQDYQIGVAIDAAADSITFWINSTTGTEVTSAGFLTCTADSTITPFLYADGGGNNTFGGKAQYYVAVNEYLNDAKYAELIGELNARN